MLHPLCSLKYKGLGPSPTKVGENGLMSVLDFNHWLYKIWVN